jgi:hypothetical protein
VEPNLLRRAMLSPKLEDEGHFQKVKESVRWGRGRRARVGRGEREGGRGGGGGGEGVHGWAVDGVSGGRGGGGGVVGGRGGDGVEGDGGGRGDGKEGGGGGTGVTDTHTDTHTDTKRDATASWLQTYWAETPFLEKRFSWEDVTWDVGAKGGKRRAFCTNSATNSARPSTGQRMCCDTKGGEALRQTKLHELKRISLQLQGPKRVTNSEKYSIYILLYMAGVE